MMIAPKMDSGDPASQISPHLGAHTWVGPRYVSVRGVPLPGGACREQYARIRCHSVVARGAFDRRQPVRCGGVKHADRAELNAVVPVDFERDDFVGWIAPDLFRMLAGLQ